MNSNSKLFRLAVIGIRLFLGLTFFTSGMGKLTHGDFPGYIGPVWLEERLAPYGLALWVQFVAWAQLTIGLLLLSQRFATIGAIMLLPMLSNILMVTISLRWQGTPYVNGFLLALNLFLLAADYHKIKFLVFEDVEQLKSLPLRSNNIKVDAVMLLGFAVCFASAALHSISRWLTFSLSAVGVLLILFSAVLQSLAGSSKSSLARVAPQPR